MFRECSGLFFQKGSSLWIEFNTVYNTGKCWILKYIWNWCNEATYVDLAPFEKQVAMLTVAQIGKKFITTVEPELFVKCVSRIGSEDLANQPPHLRSQNFAETVIFIFFSSGEVLWCSIWLLSKHWPCSRSYSEDRGIFIRNKYSLWCLGKYMDSYPGTKGIK